MSATEAGAATSSAPAGPAPAAESFRIISPRDGDRYQVPPGVDPRYATIALRAGGSGTGAVRWFVDGRAVPPGRWTLRPGVHVVRALAGSGTRDTARIEVE